MHTSLVRLVAIPCLFPLAVGASVISTGCSASDADADEETVAEDALGNEEQASSESAVSAGGACRRADLRVCLDYKGGKACYAKWGCRPGDEASTGDEAAPRTDGTSGAAFASFYRNNYETIVAARRRFHPATSFTCASTASTALKLAGYSLRQVTLTNDVERQLVAKGWKRITDMRSLRAGDVVFTDKQTSNVPGTYSHVYVFQRYVDGGTAYAMITDNNGQYIKRNVGPGSRSRSVVAYRAP